MINALQIIVLIPLFSLSFPVNVQICFGLLVQITQFNIVSTTNFDQSTFPQFSNTDPYNDNFNAMDIFSKHTNKQ